jgi:hypothetical protein
MKLVLFVYIITIIQFRKLRCSELPFRDGKPNNSYTTFVDELPFGRLIKSSEVLLKFI